MRRGTTPTHNFETEIDLTEADVIYITYAQRKSEDYIPLRVDPTLSKVFDEEFETILELKKDCILRRPAAADALANGRWASGTADYFSRRS